MKIRSLIGRRIRICRRLHVNQPLLHRFHWSNPAESESRFHLLHSSFRQVQDFEK